MSRSRKHNYTMPRFPCTLFLLHWHFFSSYLWHLWVEKIGPYNQLTEKEKTPTYLRNVLYLHSVMLDSLQPHGLEPVRLLCPWDSLGKNNGVDCHALLQGIFLTQGLNPGLLHCKQVLFCLSYREEAPTWEMNWYNLLVLVKNVQLLYDSKGSCKG